MLYFLFEYLEAKYQLPGAGLFQYVSFRSALAFIISLFISVSFGHKIIRYLKDKQIGETIRDLGLKGQKREYKPLRRRKKIPPKGFGTSLLPEK